MKQEMNDMTRNNKTGIKTHTITVVVMLIFCLLRVSSGLNGWGYVLIAAVLGVSPIIVERVCFKKNTETTMIKHCISYGFALFYTFILFTADNNMVFLFVIPMILVVSIYNDMRYCILVNMGVLIENILVISLGARNGAFGFIGRDYAVIQIVIVILVGTYSVMTSKTLMKNEKYRITKLMEAKQESESSLERLAVISEHMKTNIHGGYQEIEKLNTASKLTKEAMDEVSTGITEVADAVQNQILQTEEIKNKVDLVSNATNLITGHMKQTLQVLENGNKDVEELVRQVEVSVNNGASVAEKLQTLDKYMKEMNSIVELIADITSQTELLALNASIEAARAGEAGKGFAVVAAEINNMAAQTQNATGNIADLIHNVSTSINEVVTVIWDMISGINEQKSSTKRTADSFISIQKNTYAVRDHAEVLSRDVKQLKEANSRIMENIQTISAISEEVSAHANETIQAEEENLIVLKELSNNMEETIQVISQ